MKLEAAHESEEEFFQEMGSREGKIHNMEAELGTSGGRGEEIS